MATSTENKGNNTTDDNKANKPKQLKTELPLSEKDEVKKAEQKTNKGSSKKP